MHVRSLEASADRYVRNSIQAYLDGSKNLSWVTGVIGKSGVPLARCQLLFTSCATHNERASSLAHWFLTELNANVEPVRQ